MTDIVDETTRSRMMAGIRGKDTRPELLLRRALHARGFRYRLHVKELIGRPDLLLPKHCAAIFVHGCFWHRHEGCKYAATPATRAEFWRVKFEANAVRDFRVRIQLHQSGWRVATIWECALRSRGSVEITADVVEDWLLSNRDSLEIGMHDLHCDRG